MQHISNSNSDMKLLPMHEALKPLAWLEGTWITKHPGVGIFPTITSFKYCEEITFTSIGQPMLNYTARSWNSDTKKPMHYETGFLKIVPNTNRVCLFLSHNFGVTTIEEGEVEDKIIHLKTTNIGRSTEKPKPPIVTEIQREFKLSGDCLQQTLYMATEKTPELQEHLHAIYVKKCENSL